MTILMNKLINRATRNNIKYFIGGKFKGTATDNGWMIKDHPEKSKKKINLVKKDCSGSRFPKKEVGGLLEVNLMDPVAEEKRGTSVYKWDPSFTKRVNVQLKQKTMDNIWNQLIKSGLSKEQAAGIMGNMAVESGFDHTAGVKENKSFQGIVQMSKVLRDNAYPIYGSDLNGQVKYITDYALGRLNTATKKDKAGNPYSSNIGYLSGAYVKAKHTNPEDSAYHWAYNFERPYIQTGKDAKGKPIYKMNAMVRELYKKKTCAKSLHALFIITIPEDDDRTIFSI